ncbi:MAG: hypothetical protein GY854_00955 [Deltaproteobacteria bacterium]|nr:hypothetical protein [Deltaproteobacteria bacterium]
MIIKTNSPIVVFLSAALTCCGSCVVKNPDNGSTAVQETSAPASQSADEQTTSPESPPEASKKTSPSPDEKATDDTNNRVANAGKLVVGEDACKTDEDCVPGGCCHPRACVAKENRPSCEGTKCTLICLSGTLDCGGKCLCHEGKCAAKLSGPFVRPSPPEKE